MPVENVFTTLKLRQWHLWFRGWGHTLKDCLGDRNPVYPREGTDSGRGGSSGTPVREVHILSQPKSKNVFDLMGKFP